VNESMSCTGTRFSRGRGFKNSPCTCQKLDGVAVAATRLCQSFVSAFFASLEWCSCFYVDTNDDGPDADSTSATSLILSAEKDDSATFRFFNQTWTLHIFRLGPRIYIRIHNQHLAMHAVACRFGCMHVYILSLASSFNLKTTVQYCHDFKDKAEA